MPLGDQALLRKWAIVESINDQLKNISQIEHTRHRSLGNFMVNLVSWADGNRQSAQETITSP
jgi:hypothetical protein